MSDDAREELAVPSAKEAKSCAARWLMERRLAENWSDADQAKLDAWLTESPAHLIAYVRLEAAWSRTDRLVVLRNPISDMAEAAPSRAALPLYIKTAAAIGVVAILGTAAANALLYRNDAVFSTPVGGHETVKFADGTRIELNTNTSLRARMTKESRTIWLDRGEAYFQVKHDSASPFVVIAGNQHVTDLGTKFVMRRDASRLQVALLDGRVRFGMSDGNRQSALLSPGDVAVATSNSISVKKASSQMLSNELSWRHGVLIFKHTTLGEAAREFNRYNRKKLVIADEPTARLKIYGTFRVQDAEQFARVTQDVLGLRLETDADEIVISR
ncbi:MAG TPA: FecR domain-containing protein [Rhizomicrobium sp.]|nr:FecR domain-containing protein [Rhizomicrobium sp.]